MDRHYRQRRAFEFLQSRDLESTFTLAEFAEATGWAESSVDTNIGKGLRDVVQTVAPRTYRVLPEIQRFTIDRFLRHLAQTRQLYSAYDRVEYDQVVSYEFLLPLTRETQLRATLDELFFRDTLGRRLREIGLDRVAEWFGRSDEDDDAAFVSRILGQVDTWFAGYSISFVQGRFRAAALRTRIEAAQLATTGKPYLIDETTALVRFLVPVHGKDIASASQDRQMSLFDAAVNGNDSRDDAVLVRQLFFELFVEAVVRTIDGEDEIWLLEDTPLERSLHVWRKR